MQVLHAEPSLFRQLDAWVDAIEARVRGGADDEQQLVQVFRIFAAAARVGHGITESFERAANRTTGRIGKACRAAHADLLIGKGVQRSVDAFAIGCGGDAAALFARIVSIQHRRGGSLAEPCHRLASLMQERLRLDAEARSATAQARFSARAVIAVPLLLGVLAGWRSPGSVARFADVGALMLASPGLLLIVAGAVAAHRIAGAAATSSRQASPAKRRSRLADALRRLGGSGSRSQAALRIGAVSALVAVMCIASTGASPPMVVAAVLLVGAGAAWPYVETRRSQRFLARRGQIGCALLLEVSIALFAAGASAREVAVAAPAAAAEPLRSILRPAVHGIELGRSIASAFADVPEVAASAQLDGWLHAVCTSAELGTPALPTLEGLLRDARALRREEVRAAAQTAAPRMQLVLVLCVVPGVMWIMLLATAANLVGQLQGSGVL